MKPQDLQINRPQFLLSSDRAPQLADKLEHWTGHVLSNGRSHVRRNTDFMASKKARVPFCYRVYFAAVGKRTSWSLFFSTNASNGLLSFRLVRSTRPFSRGWYGVIRVLSMPRQRHIPANRILPKFLIGMQSIGSADPFLHDNLGHPMRMVSHHLVKQSANRSRYLSLLRVTVSGPIMSNPTNSLGNPTMTRCNGTALHTRIFKTISFRVFCKNPTYLGANKSTKKSSSRHFRTLVLQGSRSKDHTRIIRPILGNQYSVYDSERVP